MSKLTLRDENRNGDHYVTGGYFVSAAFNTKEYPEIINQIDPEKQFLVM